MEQSRRSIFGRLSFRRRRPLAAYAANDRIEEIGDRKPAELYKENLEVSKCCRPLELPSSPQKAMEFLSRTWSPSSYDFFQLLSSNSAMPCCEDGRPEENSDGEEEQLKKNKVNLNAGSTQRVDQIWTVHSRGKAQHSAPQKHKIIHTDWLNIEQMKSWLKGGVLLTGFSRGYRRRKKEEVRLHVAQVHAALSVARLAAAVAGIVANCSMEPVNSNSLLMARNGGGGDWDKMSTVVASAAALIATVCAEAAESVGAARAHVASVVNTGLETQTATDVLTLTAAAATCLRGAAALEPRTTSRSYASEDRKILQRGARLPVRTPEGRVQLRMVSIYLKNDRVMLRLGKKHLHGAFTTYEEYRICNEVEDTKEDVFSKENHGVHAITLGTTGGTIQLLFEDPKQYRIWRSNIFPSLVKSPSET
ncbi:VAN3-binding protein-like isoform X1 [Ananas comosus]|uniref:VAN3-binding protein-like isoform X1 n=1 Tax=Ananas comosus TaxID=4615 RepID=A0A6P5FSW9_ANACO|nr:VAN3-binding protein-like isoform X1 [Ananas comosus]XP_020096636.1 VAN3-binding protein-like isoform X1 [Ananas comosus]XP_020096637.1 VAN3-binding protein-like isoform X1 [Ananas comosus]XP_020096638.1 VAN3-binding protein-like isoform X1 [Ananas comosus]XP_020096639.1 VAN3-binding protein-like isoform X1 [Ananas comosus]XP_020096640.1 VAN3-binding protein-like isoform X1 [Ananas comosus]XP_020096641.1 VAN3-binding protein-like isoform X1 [Ananas comosus]XP_020096642.1 VAN3-binding prot